MIEIGQNLQHPLYDLQGLTKDSMRIRNSSAKTSEVALAEIKKIELAGIQSNSGFSGTMEWGMRNPTFLLPTNLLYNIINLFKRRDDTVYFKVIMNDESVFMVRGKKSSFSEIQKLITK